MGITNAMPRLLIGFMFVALLAGFVARPAAASPLNQAPVGGDDFFSTAVDTPLTISAPGILANDTDPDGDTLIVSGPTPATNGDVVVNADGSFTYTPHPGFSGVSSFAYSPSDGVNLGSQVSVTIDISWVNQTPVGIDDSYNTPQDTPLTIGAPGILANDTDPDGDPLTVLGPGPASHGTVLVNVDGSFTYTPNAGYSGYDQFVYSASDGNLSAIATVQITVEAAANQPPVAVADSYNIPQDTPLIVSAPGILANDSDPDGDPIELNGGSSASHGTVLVNADGSFTYTPDPGFSGQDGFTYNARDPMVTVSNQVFVAITVEAAANQPPVAVDDSYSTPQDTPLTIAAPGLLANDSDPDGDPLAVGSTGLRYGSHGYATLNADGSFTYTAQSGFNGVDVFQYYLTDGADYSGNANVTITVGAGNIGNAPVGVEDSYTTPQDTPLTITAPGVLANDTDLDGDPLTAVQVNTPPHGTAVLNADGSFTYTPDPGFHGKDGFLYYPSDGTNLGLLTAVGIEVGGSNQSPVGVDDSYSTPPDTKLQVDAPGILANDTDPDGDTLTVKGNSTASHGVVSVDSDGLFAYIPDPGFSGVDSFEYILTDGVWDVSHVTVTITVTAESNGTPTPEPPGTSEPPVTGTGDGSGTTTGTSTDDDDLSEKESKPERKSETVTTLPVTGGGPRRDTGNGPLVGLALLIGLGCAGYVLRRQGRAC